MRILIVSLEGTQHSLLWQWASLSPFLPFSAFPHSLFSGRSDFTRSLVSCRWLHYLYPGCTLPTCSQCLQSCRIHHAVTFFLSWPQPLLATCSTCSRGGHFQDG